MTKSTCFPNPNFQTEVDLDLPSADSQLRFISPWSTFTTRDSIILPYGLVVVLSMLLLEVCLKDIFNTCSEYSVAYHSEVAMETGPSGHKNLLVRQCPYQHRPSFICGRSKCSFSFNLTVLPLHPYLWDLGVLLSSIFISLNLHPVGLMVVSLLMLKTPNPNPR